MFNYITGSWLFNPAHFAERLKDKKYEKQLSDRAPSHVPFVKAWISEQFPNYELSGPDVADKLTHWYSTTRAVVRDRVLAMYPYVAQRYYVNRGDYFREIEENRLRELIKASITVGLDGWNGDLPEPSIIVKCATQQNQIRGIEPHKMSLLITGPLKPPPSPTITAYTKIGMKESLGTPESSSSDLSLISEATIWSDMEKTPLTLEELPRSPPREYVLRPPPEGMPVNAKLLCLARWTRFDASGNPYISSEPREKNFAMDWASSGAEDVALVRWAKYMWWHIWVRQHRVNYVGMWKKRFEEEDRKAEKNRWGELADGFKEIHDACEKCASVLEGAGNRGLRA